MRSRREIQAKPVTVISPEEEAFIAGAKADRAEGVKAVPAVAQAPAGPAYEPEPPAAGGEDRHAYVHRTNWPILPCGTPDIASGRADLDKPFLMRLKEDLWNSIERHCRAMGVGKSEWVRHAIMRQLAEEQEWFRQRALSKNPTP